MPNEIRIENFRDFVEKVQKLEADTYRHRYVFRGEGKYTGFLGWMYDFLTFKKLTIENVLKILYLICAIFITLSSFSMISASFLAFLLYLVVGNLVARVSYELILVKLIICRNTTEINKKLDKKD